ncbi:unnamed protein product [Danaus chrysippus]|uniref:(African queen) hypothetical protein n=1 Tax=Danaus chrysippus TaxID=151541 RepID=A0A8J2VX98_9NEOP|nr:unnamed protein product [Danaus chrysippus]
MFYSFPNKILYLVVDVWDVFMVPASRGQESTRSPRTLLRNPRHPIPKLLNSKDEPLVSVPSFVTPGSQGPGAGSQSPGPMVRVPGSGRLHLSSQYRSISVLYRRLCAHEAATSRLHRVGRLVDARVPLTTRDMSTRKICLSERNLLALIFEVKRRPCLWNHEELGYNERWRLTTAWTEIATKLKLPEDVLRNKWKNLRDLFKREAKKCNGNTVDEYTGKWRYFKTLWFLNQPGEGAASDDDDEGIERRIKEEVQSVGPDTTDEAYLDHRQDKRLYAEIELAQDPLETKRPRLDDYDSMFLMSLTPYFKQLEPMRKLSLRNKIQELIFNELTEQSEYNVLPY